MPFNYRQEYDIARMYDIAKYVDPIEGKPYTYPYFSTTLSIFNLLYPSVVPCNFIVLKPLTYAVNNECGGTGKEWHNSCRSDKTKSKYWDYIH